MNNPYKGIYGGDCNRTACQKPQSAVWFNKSTLKYYCGECAEVLNRVNKEDATRLNIYPLCVHEQVK